MAVRTERLGVGIVGIGWCAAQHITAFNHNPHAEVRLLCGRDEGRVRASLARSKVDAPAARITTRFDDLLESPDIDIIAIATPNHLHAAQAVAAAQAGKHILLEKPLEADTARAEAVVETCERAGVRLGVVLQHRFRPAARALAGWLRESALGDIAAASVCVPWWRPQSYYDEPGRGTLARDGGGVLITQAIHTLDLFLSLTPPLSDVAAFAATTPLHRMETEDIACAALRFRNGALGTLDATTASYPGFAERISIVGTRGTAQLIAGKVDVHWHDGRRESVGEEATLGGGADPMAFANDAHRTVLAEFLDAIEQDRPPRNDGRSALLVHDLIDAVLASSRAHTPITVRQRTP